MCLKLQGNYPGLGNWVLGGEYLYVSVIFALIGQNPAIDRGMYSKPADAGRRFQMNFPLPNESMLCGDLSSPAVAPAPEQMVRSMELTALLTL